MFDKGNEAPDFKELKVEQTKAMQLIRSSKSFIIIALRDEKGENGEEESYWNIQECFKGAEMELIDLCRIMEGVLDAIKADIKGRNKELKTKKIHMDFLNMLSLLGSDEDVVDKDEQRLKRNLEGEGESLE